jgi:uncharacterized protein YndB with AHSA1/START domain
MRESTDPDIRVRGTLGSVDGTGVVRIEMPVAADVATIWAAVTEPERLAGWAGEIRGDLREGGRWTAHLFPSGWEGEGRVLTCEPGRRWVVEGAEPGHPLSTDELEITPDDAGGCRVVLTERGAALGQIQYYGVGVQLHLENLAAYLAGRPPVDPDPYWERLLPEYERLAAALG